METKTRKPLYQLTAEAAELLAVLSDIQAPEEAIKATQDLLLEDSEDARERCAFVIRRLSDEADSQRKIAQEFTKAAQAKESHAAHLKARILEHLQAVGVTEAQAGLFRFTITNNGGSVPVELTGDVPMDYCKVEVSPDIELIRKTLEAGTDVPNAKIGQRGQHLRIRA